MNYTNLDERAHLDKVADMVVVNIRHKFSEDELDQQAQLIAQAVTDKASEESNKKVAMATFKTKIDELQGKINLYATYLTNGFMYVDKPAEMYRDYARAKRVYFDKASGNFLSEENFHASDYQKKIDFEAREEELRLEDIERNRQIEENNQAGHYADGITDALAEVISDKKMKVVAKDDDYLPDDNDIFGDIK